MLLTSCKKATELMELKEEGRLGTFEILGLRLHTMMCSACRNYERQRELLVRAMARQQPSNTTDQEAEALKARINDALKKD